MRKNVVKPVEIAIRDFEKRKPEDLFENELKFNPRAYEFARRCGRFFLEDISYYDPHNIMAEYGHGPAVRACNHDDFTNPHLLGLTYANHGFATPRYAAMAELFRNSFAAGFIGGLGGFPLDRARLAAGEYAYVRQFLSMTRYVLGELRQPIDIFPEGKIDRDAIKAGLVSGVGSGAIKLAQHSKVPLIITGQVGGRMSIPKAVIPLHKTRATLVTSDVVMPGERITADQLRAKMQAALRVAIEVHRS